MYYDYDSTNLKNIHHCVGIAQHLGVIPTHNNSFYNFHIILISVHYISNITISTNAILSNQTAPDHNYIVYGGSQLIVIS